MKIKDTIRSRRKELGLTQGQVADYLGVTASAVHKWESGSAYPDITILPALARMLQTDLNTLLAFRDDLTDDEIAHMAAEVVDIVKQQGYEEGFKAGMNLLHEYPHSEELLYQITFSLEGVRILNPQAYTGTYEETVLGLYRRMAGCKTDHIRKQADKMLFFHHLNKEEYDTAEEIVNHFKVNSEEWEELYSQLLVRQGKLEEAGAVVERQLLTAAGEVQGKLSMLQVIALKEGDVERACYLAGVNREMVRVMDLWEYGGYSAFLEVYCFNRDVEGLIDILSGMLDTADRVWKFWESPLYRHLPAKEGSMIQQHMRENIIHLVREDESFAFFRESEKGASWIQSSENKEK